METPSCPREKGQSCPRSALPWRDEGEDGTRAEGLVHSLHPHPLHPRGCGRMRPPAEHGDGEQCPEPPPPGLLPDLPPQASFLLRSCENPAEAAEGLAGLERRGLSGKVQSIGDGDPRWPGWRPRESAGRRQRGTKGSQTQAGAVSLPPAPTLPWLVSEGLGAEGPRGRACPKVALGV